MDVPQLTMVIPVRNRPELIMRVLECVEQASGMSVFDVIVVDNGSTDDTASVVRDRLVGMKPGGGAMLRLISESTPGACAARNKGLSVVRTPYVMFFDSDDMFNPELPGRIIEAVTMSDPDLVLWEVERTDGAYIPPTRRWQQRGHHLFHASLSTQRYAVRTSLVRGVGGWNESLPVWNDLELGVRLLGASPVGCYLEGKPPVSFFSHSESITGRKFSDRPGQRERSLDAIEAFYRKSGMTDMLAMVDARRLILADIYRREGDIAAASVLTKLVGSHRYNLRRRLSLKAVALTQRLLGHGGSAVALRLL